MGGWSGVKFDMWKRCAYPARMTTANPIENVPVPKVIRVHPLDKFVLWCGDLYRINDRLNTQSITVQDGVVVDKPTVHTEPYLSYVSSSISHGVAKTIVTEAGGVWHFLEHETPMVDRLRRNMKLSAMPNNTIDTHEFAICENPLAPVDWHIHVAEMSELRKEVQRLEEERDAVRYAVILGNAPDPNRPVFCDEGQSFRELVERLKEARKKFASRNMYGSNTQRWSLYERLDETEELRFVVSTNSEDAMMALAANGWLFHLPTGADRTVRDGLCMRDLPFAKDVARYWNVPFRLPVA